MKKPPAYFKWSATPGMLTKGCATVTLIMEVELGDKKLTSGDKLFHALLMVMVEPNC